MRQSQLRRLSVATAIAVGSLVAPFASAGLVVEHLAPTSPQGPIPPAVLGGYDMTALTAPVAPGTATNAAIPGSTETVEFLQKDSTQSQTMTVGEDASHAWWGGSTSTFYASPFNVNWVELIMPTGTTAFSLTLDASTSASAWLLAVDSNDQMIDHAGNTGYDMADYPDGLDVPFSINLRRNGPAQTYGFYADNSAWEADPSQACSTIEKVIVDPQMWAMGDFAISVDENACVRGTGNDTGVPEPGAVALMLVGLAGVFGTRRRS